ncbi:MAG TPA: BatA domain-containing protein, partial [Saprospiraceae bacterium]|nr:BatA domain-containing protein [Saprospiraceae bacterium]
MQFLFPAFLFSLLALAVPIIIHLFYFRKFKKVYFTNVKFLKELKKETSSRQRLRNLLVLLMRCLAIAALVFAFAQPFIPKNTTVKQGLKAISIFVDNSYSMSSLSKDITLVEKAKQRAREIINAYTDNDKFQILTNDFEGKHQRLISKEDALNMLDEIRVSPGVKELSNVLKRQQQILNTSDLNYKVAYLISDFQKNISDLSAYKDTLIEVNLIPLQSVEEKNIAIDSCWFEVPVQMANQVNPLV